MPSAQIYEKANKNGVGKLSVGRLVACLEVTTMVGLGLAMRPYHLYLAGWTSVCVRFTMNINNQMIFNEK